MPDDETTADAPATSTKEQAIAVENLLSGVEMDAETRNAVNDLLTKLQA